MKGIINLTKTRLLLELEEYKKSGTIPPYFLEGVFKQEFDDSRAALIHWRAELADAGYATQFDEIEKFIINNEVDNYTEEKEKFDLEFSIVLKKLEQTKQNSSFQLYCTNTDQTSILLEQFILMLRHLKYYTTRKIKITDGC